ncbi:hypothetical protein N7G274_006210 [Stereocaulon virgatum]|uniref:Uncharacterized protein n=1 Tax=Stereocaulon virgatum TaxID=373712 RepID=A0ABR4A845_9LECA
MPAVGQGVILFLKEVQEIDSRLLSSYNIEVGALHHPVVVLHSAETADDAVVCLLTTLNGANVEDRFHPSLYGWYLAIYPKPAPSQDYRQLRLVGDVRLRKQGYVSTRQSHRVHKSMLKPYDRSKPSHYYRLTASSLEYVAIQLQIVALQKSHTNQRQARDLTPLLTQQRQLRLFQEPNAPDAVLERSFVIDLARTAVWTSGIAFAATWWAAKKSFAGFWWLGKKIYANLPRTEDHP